MPDAEDESVPDWLEAQKSGWDSMRDAQKRKHTAHGLVQAIRDRRAALGDFDDRWANITGRDV